MASITKVTITINAPPQKVWDFLMDPENLRHWLTGFISIRHLSGTVGKEGSISKMTFLERGKEMEVSETVLFTKPNQQFTSRMESAAFSTENDIRLISFGNRTEFIQTVQFQPKGFFMKLLTTLVSGAMKKRMTNELLKLKNLIEKKA